MRWIQNLFAFIAGVLVQFNVFIAGAGGGAANVGGYGFRATDFFAVACVLMIVTNVFSTSRIVSAYLFAIAAAVLYGPTILLRDTFTATIAIHYLLYCLSGLYIAILISNDTGMSKFCYGLIAGLWLSILLYAVKDSGVSQSLLLSYGLVAGYAGEFGGYIRETPRYPGLWGHPNEAGHVGALASAAAAYFYLAERRILPLAATAVALIAVFYYTLSRGGLLAGGAIICIALLFPRNRQVLDARLIVGLAILGIIAFALSQLDFVASRFDTDPNASGNFTERLQTNIAGLRIMMANPLGLSSADFLSALRALTGGVGSPHNGFIFMGAVLGLAPLAVFVWSLAMNFRVNSKADLFFAFLALQVSISFLFEQLPGTISYIYMVCLLVARAYLKTPFGRALLPRSASPSSPPGGNLGTIEAHSHPLV